jgi:hypothetical protein
LGIDPVMAWVQIPNISVAALVIAAFDWRLVSAAILPRAVLAMELAPLSHTLISGFFFSQGFDMTGFLVDGRAAAYLGVLEAVGEAIPNAAGPTSDDLPVDR